MKRIANRLALVALTIAAALRGSATVAHAEDFPGDPGSGLPCVSTQDLGVKGLTVGVTVSVTGFSGQFDTHYEVNPRFQSDIRVLAGH